MLEIEQIKNKLFIGDCEQILKDFPEKCINLIFFSPPYADIAGKYKDGYKGVPPEDYSNWMIPKIHEMYKVLDSRGSMIINIDSRVVDGFRSTYVMELVLRIIKETGFHLYEELTWFKGKSLCHPKRFRNPLEKIYWFVKQKDFTFNLDEMRVPYDKKSLKRMERPIKKRFARTEENQEKTEYKEWKSHPLGAIPSTLIKIGSTSKRICDFHCATFPIALAEYLIKGGSNSGSLIMDPFSGTGQTLMAAKNLKRNYIGIDLIKEYCDFSRNRLTVN